MPSLRTFPALFAFLRQQTGASPPSDALSPMLSPPADHILLLAALKHAPAPSLPNVCPVYSCLVSLAPPRLRPPSSPSCTTHRSRSSSAPRNTLLSLNPHFMHHVNLLSRPFLRHPSSLSVLVPPLSNPVVLSPVGWSMGIPAPSLEPSSYAPLLLLLSFCPSRFCFRPSLVPSLSPASPRPRLRSYSFSPSLNHAYCNSRARPGDNRESLRRPSTG